MKANEFRTKTLTIMGAFGYLVAVLLLAADTLPTVSVSLQSIFIILGTSSALLGVDFGIDIFGTGQREQTRPTKPSGGATSDTSGADNDRELREGKQ